MKVLSPAVTCLLTSHMKPYLAAALESVLAQTRRDFEVVVLDSGQWAGRGDDVSRSLAACHGMYAGHPLVEWVTTGELPGLAQRRCPVAWVTNQAIRAGLARGRYVCTFYDDDLYRPEFMEKMAGYLDGHPAALAVWCSQQRLVVPPSGPAYESGVIAAAGPKRPGEMDCQVDGAQVMFRQEALGAIGDPWLPEDPGESCRHSDGVFLEKLARVCGEIPAVSEVLCVNRATPWSAYRPSGAP